MKRVSRRAWNLDIGVTMCGLSLGWSSIIGIVPVLGDIINLYLSIQVIKLAFTVDGGLPPIILGQMILNLVVDFLLGIIPFLGALAGALYKANSRNSLILEHFLKNRAAANVAKGLYVSSGSSSSSSGISSSVPQPNREINVPLPKKHNQTPAYTDSIGPEGTRVPGAPHEIASTGKEDIIPLETVPQVTSPVEPSLHRSTAADSPSYASAASSGTNFKKTTDF